MKVPSRVIVYAGVLVTALLLGLTRVGEAVTLTIDGSQTYQVIEGFGANINHRSWNNNELQPVLDALTDQAGMTLFRVIMDKADWEATNDNSDPNVMNWDYYNQVYSTPDFQKMWDMSAYLNQRGITNGLMFNFQGVGPGWMGGNTLTSGYEEEWAEMIASLLIYARSAQHSQFALAGPGNENDNHPPQGISMTSSQYVTALRRLAQLLDANGVSDLRFVGPDLAYTSTEWMSAMMDDPVIMAKLAHFGLHSYEDNAGGSAGIYDFIRQSPYPDRTYWMTEFNVWCSSCEGAQGGTNSWAYASGAARYLLYHLASGASAGLIWEGYDSQYNYYSPGQWSYWGLLGVDNINATPKTYTPRKIFYTLAQITRFVRPGAQQIDVSPWATPPVVAFYHPESGQLTLTGINPGAGPETLSGTLTHLPPVASFDLYYTDSTTNLCHSATFPVSIGSFTATVPANCVFTLVGFDPGRTAVSVLITNPPDKSLYPAPATIPIQATAVTTTGTVSRVTFYCGTTNLGEAVGPPYSLLWSNVPPGTYVLSGRATNSLGNYGVSPGVQVTVVGPIAQVDVTPTNATVVPYGTTNVGEAVGPPYSLIWSNVPPGTYVLSGRATNSLGSYGVSPGVQVTVVGPTAQVDVTPTNATVVPYGTQQFTAVAADALGTVISPPPAFVWEVSGGGFIDANGLFTAGGSDGGPFTVTASTSGISGTAGISIATNFNLAPAGLGYTWYSLTSSNNNSPRAAAPGINDDDLDTDVPLFPGGEWDNLRAYEAAGVIWPTSQGINRVIYYNGSYNSSHDGVFTSSFGLQFSPDGVTWTNAGSAWVLSPPYTYDSAKSANVGFTFTGGLATVRGVRCVGRVHPTSTGSDSWVAFATELQAFAAPVQPVGANITVQPTNQTLLAAATATFTVAASGTAPLSYQWECNGTNLDGATAATLNLANVQPEQAGGYRVVVTNLFGAETSAAAALTVLVLPPVITLHPTSQMVPLGATATFSVGAGGTPPLSYQWQFNGANLDGAVADTFTLTNVQPEHAGSYSVVVTNRFGAETSAVAIMTFLVLAPDIILNPTNQAVPVGATVSFSAEANGSPPLAYQWQFNGTNLDGAVAETLTLTNVQPRQAGSYNVVVTNAAASVTSAVATLTVLVLPPVITLHPTSQMVPVGATATLSVATSGTQPLSYQWQVNGTNLDDAVAATFTLSNAQPEHAGDYSVVVTNSVGSVTSAVATLTVLVLAPDIILNPTNQAVPVGATVSFSAEANGSPPLAYQWQFNGTNLDGAVAETLTLTNVQPDQAGSYRIVVTNAAASVISAVATLTMLVPPAITLHPTSQMVPVGATTSFSVGASGTPPLGYQWHFNGTHLDGAVAATFTLTNAQPEDAGAYSVVVTNSVGSVTSAVATLTVLVLAPDIILNPTNQAVPVGATVNFSAEANGSPPLAYQWQFNGTNLDGAVAEILTLTNVQLHQAGSYSVVVSNGAASVTSAVATLTVLVLPPAITFDPTNQTVLAGTTVNFSVAATGSAPLSYQWRFNGTNLDGILAETLFLTNVQPHQAGSYTAVVTNAAGSATSAVATLTVLVPPAITLHPTHQIALVGAMVSFGAAASGTAPLSYQWQFNGTSLDGASAETLTLTNVQSDQAGSYTTLVTNAAGSATSAVATLTIIHHSLLLDPHMVTNGAFAFTLSGDAGPAYMIEVSTNLVEWTRLGALSNAASEADFIDSAPTNDSSRFYRARLAY